MNSRWLKLFHDDLDRRYENHKALAKQAFEAGTTKMAFIGQSHNDIASAIVEIMNAIGKANKLYNEETQ